MSSESSMFKSIGFYGSATMIRGLASFIMLPIYTSVLSPADYGVLELLGLILDVTTIIIGSKLSIAILRYYSLAKTNLERNQVVYSALSLGIFINIVGIIVLWLAASQLSQLTFNTADYTLYIQIYAITLLTTVFSDTAFVVLRAMERAKQFFWFSVVKLVLQVFFNVLFIIIYDYGVFGLIMGSVISGALMSIILLAYVYQYHKFALSKSIIKSLIGFSIPVVFASLLEFYVVFGDRYFINYFLGVSAVGIYSIAYKFGFLLMMISFSPFASAWEPKAYKMAKDDKPKIFFQNYFLISMFWLIGFATIIASYSLEIVKIVTSGTEFLPAALLIPPIILAYTFQGLDGYCKFGIFVSGNTKHHFYAVFCSTVVATIGYLVFIPMYGLMGAAWVTVASIGTKALWQYFAGKHYFDMELKWKPIISLFAISIVVVIFSNSLNIDNIVLSMFAKSIIMLVYFIMIWNFTFLSSEQKHTVSSWVTEKYKSIRA